MTNIKIVVEKEGDTLPVMIIEDNHISIKVPLFIDAILSMSEELKPFVREFKIK